MNKQMVLLVKKDIFYLQVVTPNMVMVCWHTCGEIKMTSFITYFTLQTLARRNDARAVRLSKAISNSLITYLKKAKHLQKFCNYCNFFVNV